MSRYGNFRGDDRQTGRQTDRQIDRQTDIQTDGQTNQLLYPCTCAWGNKFTVVPELREVLQLPELHTRYATGLLVLCG